MHPSNAKVKETISASPAALTLNDLNLRPEHTEILASYGADTLAGLLTFNPDDLPAVLGDEAEANRIVALINANGLTFRSVTTTKTFAIGLSYMRDFIDTFGHARPTKMYEAPDGYRLGFWVMALRGLWPKNQVPPARRWLLSTLPGWTWDPRVERRLLIVAEKAEATLEDLIEFTNERDLTTVTRACEFGGERVSALLAALREAENYLTSDLRQAFTDLPGWTWDEQEAQERQDAADLAAMNSTLFHRSVPVYERFVKYVERTGSAAPYATALDEDGFPIGRWVIQRRQRRLAMRQVERDLLESLPGWTWDGFQIRSQESWQNWVVLLEQYVAEHGTAEVPLAYVTRHGEGLGGWVRKAAIGDVPMTPEQTDHLGSLPGWQWRATRQRPAFSRVAHDATWSKALEALKLFIAENGRLPRSKERNSQGANVASWATTQRAMWRAGTLPAERVARLEAEVPEWTWTPLRGNPLTNGRAEQAS